MNVEVPSATRNMFFWCTYTYMYLYIHAEHLCASNASPEIAEGDRERGRERGRKGGEVEKDAGG